MWLRDKTGVNEEEYVVDKPSITLSELIELIKGRHPGLKNIIHNVFDKENPIIVIVNGLKRDPGYILNDNDEVVLMPPVSGG